MEHGIVVARSGSRIPTSEVVIDALADSHPPPDCCAPGGDLDALRCIFLGEEDEMPIYEFRCAACGLVQERLLPMGNAGKELRCQECEREPLQRIPSTFAASGSSCASESGWG